MREPTLCERATRGTSGSKGCVQWGLAATRSGQGQPASQSVSACFTGTLDSGVTGLNPKLAQLDRPLGQGCRVRGGVPRGEGRRSKARTQAESRCWKPGVAGQAVVLQSLAFRAPNMARYMVAPMSKPWRMDKPIGHLSIAEGLPGLNAKSTSGRRQGASWAGPRATVGPQMGGRQGRGTPVATRRAPAAITTEEKISGAVRAGSSRAGSRQMSLGTSSASRQQQAQGINNLPPIIQARGRSPCPLTGHATTAVNWQGSSQARQRNLAPATAPGPPARGEVLHPNSHGAV